MRKKTTKSLKEKRKQLAEKKKKNRTRTQVLTDAPPQILLDNLLAQYQAGDLSGAEVAALELTLQYPQHPFGWKVLGAALQDQGRTPDALAPTLKLVQLSPLDPDAHLNLGAVLKDLGEFHGAEQSYIEAIRLKPDSALAHFNLGQTLQDLGRPVDAKASYEATINLEPHNAAVHFFLGGIAYDLGDLDKAKSCYETALSLRSNFTDCHYNLALVHHESGDWKQAAFEYRAVIELAPAYAAAHNNLGIVLQQAGEVEEAKASYLAALEHQPDYADAYLNLGVLSRELGELEEAEAHCIKAISVKPDFAEAHRNLATIKSFRTKDEQYRQMNQLYASSSASADDRCRICFALAKANEDLGEYERAYALYVEGNALRREQLGYDFYNDDHLFERVQYQYPRLKNVVRAQSNGEGGPVPILLVGMPRSGTTLVEQIISSHSKITGAGELSAITKRGLDIATGARQITSRTLAGFRHGYERDLRAWSPSSLLVSDKTPDNFFFVGLIAAAFPECRIVHVARNPAATCWANFRQYYLGSNLGFSYSLEDLVRYYRRYCRLMEFWQAEMGGLIYSVNYERLTENPETETRALIRYLGLDWEDACLSPQDNNRRVATASNVQIRQGIYTGSSEKWKHYKPYLNGAFEHL